MIMVLATCLLMAAAPLAARSSQNLCSPLCEPPLLARRRPQEVAEAAQDKGEASVQDPAENIAKTPRNIPIVPIYKLGSVRCLLDLSRFAMRAWLRGDSLPQNPIFI